MAVKFNSGQGAVVCDGCGRTIATGFAPSLLYCYMTTATDHVAVPPNDYCSKECYLEASSKVVDSDPD